MKSVSQACVALTFMLAITSTTSHASVDEFIGAMAGNVLGFAMVAEQFSSTACGKHVKRPDTMRIYRDAESSVFALLSPRLRGQLKSTLLAEPDLVRRSAERMLVPIDRLSGNSERENCLVMAATIISMYTAGLQTLENYATMVGIK